MRPSPNSSGQGVSDSSQPMFSAAEGIELAPIAGELLALTLDDVRRRVPDEALVSEHPFGACDLLAQTLALCLRVSVHLHTFGPHLRLEDPPLVPLEFDHHAAAEE